MVNIKHFCKKTKNYFLDITNENFLEKLNFFDGVENSLNKIKNNINIKQSDNTSSKNLLFVSKLTKNFNVEKN